MGIEIVRLILKRLSGMQWSCINMRFGLVAGGLARSKMFSVRKFNLGKTTPNNPIWDQLLSLTVPRWAARRYFKGIRAGLYPEGKFNLLAVFDKTTERKDRMIAWGFSGEFDPSEYPVLWIYTDPEFRGQGIQKEIVIPYFNQKKDCFCVMMRTAGQKKIFGALRKKIDISGRNPVDKSQSDQQDGLRFA
jgi:GNAT superfamily N-acetyltransferase